MVRLVVQSFLVVALMSGVIVGCAAGLGEPCDFDSQCPDGAICRNNIYLDALCEDGVVPIESEGPDGYCTIVCGTDEECADLPGSEGCQGDQRSGRKLCMPDCPS